MPYPTEQDKELYQRDIRKLIAQTGDPNAFILFNDPSFEKVRKKLRQTRKKDREK